MFWHRAFGLLIALTLPLAGCSGPRQDCPPPPNLVPSVDGQPVDPSLISGNGFYCGVNGDGRPVTSLEPVPARPGATVSIIYDTKARWGTATYSVSSGEEELQRGEVPSRGISFQLPDEPGTYNNGFSGESRHGQLNTYFRVRIGEPEPEAYLYPDVPIHPNAHMSDLISEQRGAIRVGGKSRAEIMAWYAEQLPARGWRAETTSRAPDQVLLFSKAGEYLSLSAQILPASRGFIVWFHLGPTPEVTGEQAIAIARNTHSGNGEWLATYQSSYQGASHPLWMVELKPGNDAVWIDAITAEVLTIRE